MQKSLEGKDENKMLTQFSRTELLIGKEAMDKLNASRVAVFGVGASEDMYVRRWRGAACRPLTWWMTIRCA